MPFSLCLPIFFSILVRLYILIHLIHVFRNKRDFVLHSLHVFAMLIASCRSSLFYFLYLLDIKDVRSYICAEWHLRTICGLEQGGEMVDCGNDSEGSQAIQCNWELKGKYSLIKNTA
jgi:hypothetical protein